MKIAVINDTVYPFSKGGAQKRVYEIARRLVRKGHDVYWYGMDYGHKQLDGIQLRPVCPAEKMYTNSGKRLLNQALQFGLRINIKDKADVIDCMNFPYLHCFRVKESSLRLKIPMVLTWFEYWGKYWWTYSKWIAPIGMGIERLVTRLPDKIIADSSKVGRQLSDAGVKKGKIEVVYDGVDIKLINSTDLGNQCDVIFVGRMLAHKNVDILLQALTLMPGVTATFIGDGECSPSYKRLADKLKLNKRVKFTGYIQNDSEVYSLIKSAKVLVLPSTQEGHPLVIPEAHACGIPVVAINGICNEFIRHKETGYLADVNPTSLSTGISWALDNYKRVSKLCISQAAMFDWDNITAQIENVYKGLI